MITTKTNQNNVPGSTERTILRNLDDPKMRKEALKARSLIDVILSDIQSIEQRDGKAMAARTKLLLDCVDLVKMKGLNLRTEALGTLTTEMLTAKDGWCQTSFAPSIGQAWKTLSQSRKAILRESSKVLHYVVKSNIITEVKGKRCTDDGMIWCNMEYATESMKKSAKQAPIFAFSFAELLRAASSVLSEEGEEQASAIELRCQQLIKALNEKSFEDIPAKAWNDLGVLGGRISTLFREREKAQGETPAGQKRAAQKAAKGRFDIKLGKVTSTAYDSAEDVKKPLAERKAS